MSSLRLWRWGVRIRLRERKIKSEKGEVTPRIIRLTLDGLNWNEDKIEIWFIIVFDQLEKVVQRETWTYTFLLESLCLE